MLDTILLIIPLIGMVVIIFLLMRSKANNSGQTEEKITVLLERMQNLSQQNKDFREEVDNKLSQINKISQDQFGKNTNIIQNISEQTSKTIASINSQSQKAIQEVTEKLTKLDETNKQVVNFSAQLQNLQDILKNPKQRGVLGEYFLEETLKNVLPPNSYQMQYNMGVDPITKKDLIVDAVVFVKDKIIPIDSKFSLENYERILDCNNSEERKKLEKAFKQDLKDRIDETSKYVATTKNTVDFAFMFIPSEAIYYDLLVNKVGAIKVNTRDLIEYAFRDKKVVIVSPTSFLAYLQTVLQGLRALQIEESAKHIKANVEKLSRHLISYEDFIKKLGNSLGTTVNHYNSSYQEFKKINKDILKITDKGQKIEPEILEKPKTS